MKINITENTVDTLTSSNNKKIVGTQISQELYMKLKTEADNDFMSISDLLRKIIFKYYANRKDNM